MFKYGNILLLPGEDVQKVIEEVYDDDCYRIDEIPTGSIVLDIGAFGGEFGIKCCVEKDCRVMAYEPVSRMFNHLILNVKLNELPPDIFVPIKGAIGKAEGDRILYYRPGAPASSQIEGYVTDYEKGGELIEEVTRCYTISSQIAIAKQKWGDLPICVKMDCEGAEAEIFENSSWIDDIHIVTMEWHNYDGDLYANMLEKRGFSVFLEGGGPKPRPQWNKTIGGGLLFAKRNTSATH